MMPSEWHDWHDFYMLTDIDIIEEFASMSRLCRVDRLSVEQGIN
jgi:hypothetical protein